MAWKTKVFRDANHAEIVRDLERCGLSVIDLAAVGHSCPDIVVANRKVTVLIEIKIHGGRFYLDQLEFLAKWPGVAGFAETTEQALRLIHEPETYRLTPEEQITIRNIVIRARQDAVAKSDRSKAVAEKMARMTVLQFEKRFKELGGRVW